MNPFGVRLILALSPGPATAMMHLPEGRLATYSSASIMCISKQPLSTIFQSAADYRTDFQASAITPRDEIGTKRIL